MIIHFAQKKFWEVLSYCLYVLSYNFELCHMTAEMSYLYGFTKIITFIVYVHKEITL